MGDADEWWMAWKMYTRWRAVKLRSTVYYDSERPGLSRRHFIHRGIETRRVLDVCLICRGLRHPNLCFHFRCAKKHLLGKGFRRTKRNEPLGGCHGKLDTRSVKISNPRPRISTQSQPRRFRCQFSSHTHQISVQLFADVRAYLHKSHENEEATQKNRKT